MINFEHLTKRRTAGVQNQERTCPVMLSCPSNRECSGCDRAVSLARARLEIEPEEPITIDRRPDVLTKTRVEVSPENETAPRRAIVHLGYVSEIRGPRC